MARPTQEERLQIAAEMIINATGLLFTAGAGMGVDSGLPNFRGQQGFWKAYPSLARRRVSFKSVARAYTFKGHPRLAWGFYGHGLNLYRSVTPHSGFGILKRWGDAMADGYGVFTSNVDGHFQRAGLVDGPVCEQHGSIHYLQCSERCADHLWTADDFSPQVDEETCLLVNDLPHCPQCGAVARPNIMMFDDFHVLPTRQERQALELKRFLDQCQRLVVIEIGAGKTIATVRRFGEKVAHQHQGRLIRINPVDFKAPPRAMGLATSARSGLEAIDRLIGER